jgi:hypothetical protein
MSVCKVARQVADLNFPTDTYQWLVVNQNGSNAQFKGSGTISGLGEYAFMVWARDEDSTYGDMFRIKLWYEADSGQFTVYDNGVDQAIGGGSIVVHKAKTAK